MQALEAENKSESATRSDKTADAESRWLIGIVANVSNRPQSEISVTSRLADLGFDSLMFVELASAIENAGGSVTAPERLSEAQDLRELATVVSRRPGASVLRDGARSEARRIDDDEIHVPSFVSRAGTKAGDVLQRVFYDKFLDTHYEGRSNIPAHTNFIVAANHSSHLDMGLTKMALGESGKDMVVLAAADYFFDTKYKRAVMENFTNLVPMERTGSLRQSLRHASSFLERGYNALIFPEGTRSVTGEMADFKPVIGYLALHTGVGILPVYLHGTYDAMPKGSNIIKNRKVGARTGRYLELEVLEEMTKGLPRAEAYRLIAALVRHEVENLRDRTRRPFDAKELRKRWKAERRRTTADRGRTTGDDALDE
jgi:long-chain acyl-CoA synthetase